MDNFDGKDLYSFDNSSNKIENGETSFDLNSFSSRANQELETETPEQKEKEKKLNRKQRTIKILLTVFLVVLSPFHL